MLDRKEQILDVAGELLQTRSFNSFSYQDLSDRIGISKASIHHHFASKEDLGVALAARIRVGYVEQLEQISQKYPSPWDQLDAYFNKVGEVLHTGSKICPVGCLQAEHNVISKEMQEEVQGICRAVQSWVSRVVMNGRKKGVMIYPGTPDDQAALICAAVQGALQKARASCPTHFTVVTKQLKTSMKDKGKR